MLADLSRVASHRHNLKCRMTETKMPPTLIVRPVALLDYDRWRPLWDGYNAFYFRIGATAMKLYDKVATRSGFVVYRKILS